MNAVVSSPVEVVVGVTEAGLELCPCAIKRPSVADLTMNEMTAHIHSNNNNNNNNNNNSEQRTYRLDRTAYNRIEYT